MFPYLITPWLPTNCDLPPTVYSLLNSICNFDSVDKTNIYNLARVGRTKIFDFTYPLTNKVTKEEFETIILNHYMMRRIGFDTPTAFKLALNVKLNEIMPLYNKLFDALDGWDVFSDGEKLTRVKSENGSSESTIDNTNISDRRFSNVPQNELDNIKDGNYMTDYNYDTNTLDGTNNISTENNTDEVVTKSPADKIKIYKELQENIKSVYSLIFKELDSLFYGLV